MDVISSHQARSLIGKARVPGDKSVSHRALLFGALATGETCITGLLEGEDILATAAAIVKLGSSVERTDDGSHVVVVYRRGDIDGTI